MLDDYSHGEPQVNSKQPITAPCYLRSSVLGGQVIAEYDGQGVRQDEYVYAGGGDVRPRVSEIVACMLNVWRMG